MPHSEVMNIVTSGNPHAQALLMGLLAHFTPAQRQYVLALLPPGKGRNLPAGGRGGGAFAASLTSHNQSAPPPPATAPEAPPRAQMRPCFSCNQHGHEWKHCPRCLARVGTPEGTADYHAFRHMAAAQRAPAPPQ
ncbi:hypothetical protein PLESTM_001915700 [Pleodorina starrii]|nr:hypothetical protein PLESTM_001915700 [Pleodorina starrii]